MLINQVFRKCIIHIFHFIIICIILTPLFSCSRFNERTASPTTPPSNVSIPVGMGNPPLDKICDYQIIGFFRRDLGNSQGRFDATVLDEARSCGTRAIVVLHGHTGNILNDDNVGLNMVKFEDRINDFAGLIDPYVEDGTILALLVIDEPHDCHDWGGQCPEPSEVDQASQIAKEYWPNLPTMVNTIYPYASRYAWQHTDIINFQYAFHKGDLNDFVTNSLKVLDEGLVRDISWTIMVNSGGCKKFGQCPMSPEQVVEVGKAMCGTGEGLYLGLVSYNEDLLDEEMEEAIREVIIYCGGLHP